MSLGISASTSSKDAATVQHCFSTTVATRRVRLHPLSRPSGQPQRAQLGRGSCKVCSIGDRDAVGLSRPEEALSGTKGTFTPSDMVLSDLTQGCIPLSTSAPSNGNIDLTGAGDAVLAERMAEIRIREGEHAEEFDPLNTMDTEVCKKGVLSEVLLFAVPALGSVLADPLMSLVDTACVGQYSSLHLAALAPNTSVFNLFFQLFTFLGYTTTNLIASNSVKAEGLTAAEKQLRTETASRVLAHSLVLAVGSGLTCTLVMLACGPALLTAMGASAETLGPALSYLQIRALASPAVMVANVAQGACLGQQDSWTPLKVFATSGMVNLVLDVVLISQFGMGISGAAVATTFAQVVAASYFVWYCWSQGKKGKAVPLKWHGLPTLNSLKPFWEVAHTLLSRTVFTCMAYTGVSTVSAGLGFLAAASHQVALQVFWFLSYVPESLSLTAQSLIARDMNNPAKARVISHSLMQLGGAVGMAMAALFAGAMLGCPWLFSNDAAVHSGMEKVVLPGALACYGICMAMIFDGISIGSSQMRHLPRANLTALIACFMVAMPASSFGFGLAGTWAGFTAFTFTRIACHLIKYASSWTHGLFGKGQLQWAAVYS